MPVLFNGFSFDLFGFSRRPRLADAQSAQDIPRQTSLADEKAPREAPADESERAEVAFWGLGYYFPVL